jgi:hypothetical protein
VDDWILALGLGSIILLLMTFLLGLRALYSRISPLLEQFTNTQGQFQLPKITIKQALGWGVYKIVESADFSKLLGRFLGGGK